MSFTLNCKECKHYLVCAIRLMVNRLEADFPDLEISFKRGKCIYENENLDYDSLKLFEYVKLQQKKEM